MPPRSPDYQSGHTIPGTVYRVHHVVGAGGMGTVYDVEDITVGKRYVLKTLHADLADRQDLAARLAREARALAKLQHPNIVEVYTSGTTQDVLRLPFYVMERLHGESLSKVIGHKGRLTVEQACDIGIDLLDALDHAHEFGIIHRDVKPDNIFVTRGRDGRSLAKLLDFGIIKLSSAPGGNPAQQTGGHFIGTFRYAPPEQILGREVTPRSDLYAAGLVLYEMIAGRGPFDDFTGEMEVGKAHIDVPPPPLSRFAEVPAVVEALVMSALQKDPAQRPRDAFTFASALRDFKKKLSQGVPLTQAKTVNRVVVQPASQALPFSEVRTEVAVPDQVSTRIDVPPAGMQGGDGPSRTQTVSMGVLPLGPPPQTTFAAAPVSVAVAAVPAIVNRRAETREAVHPAVKEPNNDTAPILLSVLAQRPPSGAPPPIAASETFGPHTTVASQRKVKTRSTLMMGGAIIAAMTALATLAAWRHHAASTATASAQPSSAGPAASAVVSVATVPDSVADPSASPSVTPAADTTRTAVLKQPPAATHKTPPPPAVTTGTTTQTATTAAPTTTHRRVGSGL